MANLSKSYQDYFYEFREVAKESVERATQVLRNIVSEHCELAPTEYTKETALELVAINFCYIDGTTMMWQGGCSK